MTERFRADFPQLAKAGPSGPLVYLDNSCMTLKPRPVIDAVVRYYEEFGSCGGRSLHKLSTGVAIEVDRARRLAAESLGAEPGCVVFTRNTTEAINLVMRSYPFRKGDLVVTSDREHNSNLAPWHLAKEVRGIRHGVVPSLPDGTFDVEGFKSAVKGARLVSMVHSSNLDGYTLPARDIAEIAHDAGAEVLLDGAQAMPHMEVDVGRLGCDLYAFSVHKMCGPTGVGVLYGRRDLLKSMSPFIAGGDTVERTTYDGVSFLDPPNRFEAGLQDYAGLFGAAAAFEYIRHVGRGAIHSHERKLNLLAHELLAGIPGLSVVGVQDPNLRGGITGFNIDGFDPHDIAIVLDETANVMVRSGMHCVHSWFLARGVKGSARASFYLYNTEEDVRALVEALSKVAGA